MKKKKQLAKIGLLLGLVGGLITILTYHLAYWQRVYPGVTVLGQSLANQTPAEAEQTILAVAGRGQKIIVLQSAGQQWPINLNEIDFRYQPAKTSDQVFGVGRNQPFWKSLNTKIHCWFAGCDLVLDYSLNQKALEAQLDTIATQVFIPTIEPTIEIKNLVSPPKRRAIQVQAGQAGQQLDKRQLLTQIHQALAYHAANPISLPLLHLSPQLTDQQVATIKVRAENLLAKNLVLVHQPPEQTQSEEWLMSDEELINFLDFSGGYKQDQIEQWVKVLAASINRPVQDALFQFLPDTQRVVEFKPARKGQVLEETETVALIISALEQLEADKNEVSAQLPVSLIDPQTSTADANSLGIRELIGQGVSYYTGSISDRVHNLTLAANKLNGVLVPPEEIFSFNEKVGEISVATGYRRAYIIKEGRTILDDGGGVCQISTTMFRAALAAGLPITERQAHAYRVSYYEQQYQPGFDATVFSPSPDLKFKNDTPGHILIQTDVDAQQGKLIFSFYGTKDGRVVTISPARILERAAPPPDLYIDDPTLPAGQIKQLEHKIWGAKVAFDYKVMRRDEVLQEKTFWSNYQPWQAVFLRGTGG
ncbi:hypothetical protein COU97_00020 [Candidatus Shapirobacteria bacterium CG10_big_fil_rev_8_21_14_0_10_48_15]|uniref:YoaR-like putative peptidoglycan binding domain-containing protein n=1 Tax=Candidatus Shapirobacteria bacterium CG10_big_fil_rev_8_21_14_0_10_48_15 TaxID=1974484 RepID=A0A2M8L816_9BACT|nr:MAG: hypothetical protein COU97_00020 [Candidatus Shapirobacteria bacterium CG10_big_fil_rev_8_21_14_0_10_48_15]